MIDFIIQWKDLIIYGLLVLLAIVQVILVIFKKPVKVIEPIRELILKLVPLAINNVEELPSKMSSADKLNYCVAYVTEYLKLSYGYNDDEIFTHRDFIINFIELVLSTPQKKKGGN